MPIAQPEKIQAIEKICTRWQDASTAHYIETYGDEHLNHTNLDSTRYTVGKKFFHLIIGSSSAFLVDIGTGIIYGNKGWAKIDRSKIVGNAYDPNFDAAALVRDRFRYGRFENAQDGSLRQPIVRR